MIERVLEPEVMETQEESIAYDDMDHGLVNQEFVADLLATGGAAGEVLDLGTGTARIPLLLCKQTDDARVVAVDLSTSMLDLARLNIEIASLTSRIMLDRADAKDLPFADARFDVVMSNSIIHHIPQPERAIAESVRVCKPGGLLFFRDLVRPKTELEIQALSATYVGDETEHAQQLFQDSLRAALTVSEMRAIVGDLGLDPTKVCATSDRHWTWSAVKPIA